jgi:hypothetical protein
MPSGYAPHRDNSKRSDMSTTSLQDFIAKTAAKKRITFGDVRRLQRSILPDGIVDREQADQLLDLDRAVARADAAWADWLVAGVVDFAVWGERPTGIVEGEAASWLGEALTRGGPLTKAGRRIAREVRREAERVGEPIAALAAEEPADAAFVPAQIAA